MTEIGIDVQTMSVERKLRRNRKMMSITRTRAEQRVLLHRRRSTALMKTELSSSTVSLMPGTSRLMRSTSARTAVAIATVFLPDCLVTCIRTPGLPLIRMQRPDVLGRVLDLGDVPQVDRHVPPAS